ncbi:MAG: o-succinylbenzoate--CoA ligase [Myxococcota bacterium]
MSASAADTTGWLERLRANGTRENSERDWAIEAGGVRLSHGDLARGCEQVACQLESLGLTRGDVVAILAPPSLAGVCVLHAFLASGVVMLPLNARLSQVELQEALVSTSVRALLVSDDGGANHGDASGASAREAAAAADCGLFVMSSIFDRGAGPQLIAERGCVDRPASVAQRQRLAEQGAALILRTSGTTGRPKGAVLSLANLLASASASSALLETTERDRWLLCMPLFHIGGLSILVRSVLDASSVVLHSGFDAERVTESLDRDGITCVSFVATMLQRLLAIRGERRAPTSLRVLLLGGGPATKGLLSRAVDLGYPVSPTYGLTEAASQVATRPPWRPSPDPDDHAAGLEPLPGVGIRIVPETSKSLARGEGVEGEIEVRGPNVMLGYLDAPDTTDTTDATDGAGEVLRNGWLRTGDFGRIDSAGRLRVLDRRSDLILSGGENIYPAEIESVLEEHENVEEAAVVGRVDADFGARPIAFIVLREGASLAGDENAAERELRAHCEARLARFKVPVAFDFQRALPRTASGKLMRRSLVKSE